VRRLVAVDAGTTSVRALAVDESGAVLDVESRPLTQSYPALGRVEHDATEILALVDETVSILVRRLDAVGDAVAAIGVTNQRETTVALDRDDGTILAPAIVWQDRRTATFCDELARAGHAADVRARTGLTLDPYFSATKMRWLLDHAPLDHARRLGLCTVDTLVCWHLTGGARGGTYATDASNASRTLLYDLDAAAFSDELCALFGVPREALPELRASCGTYGAVAKGSATGLDGVPVAAVLGDQQAALFGLRCFAPGMAKATFGTGAFLLANAGQNRPTAVDGLVTSVAWDLGEFGARQFAREGSAFVAGAAIQWLRDELGLVARADEVGPLADSVPDSAGAYFVPALTGLGSPWWEPDARGALSGLSRGVTSAHVARAVVESLAFQARAMLDAMREGGTELRELRVDGGAAAMDLLCALLADGARLRVRRPHSVEATAVGVALLAGVAVGEVGLDALEAGFDEERAFEPRDPTVADLGYEAWLEAVRRSVALGS
jgi:glycerol kinase